MRYVEVTLNQIGDGQVIRDALERDGAVVIRGVLDHDEISKARMAVRTYLEKYGTRLMLGKTQPNAAAALPSLDYLFANQKIISLYKAVYGDNNVLFTGHCDVHMNMISGWHKDSGETVGSYFNGDYFAADECRVYKVAIYLQDTEQNDGLTVGLRSHRIPELHKGDVVKLSTRAGDLVMFDVRLDHIGRVPTFPERLLKNLSRVINRGDRNKQDPAFITALGRVITRKLGRSDRLSIFFTFGPRNSFTYDFSTANMLRQKKQSVEELPEVRPELTRRLEAQGVLVYKIGER